MTQIKKASKIGFSSTRIPIIIATVAVFLILGVNLVQLHFVEQHYYYNTMSDSNNKDSGTRRGGVVASVGTPPGGAGAIRSQHRAPLVKVVEVVDLEHEEMFRSTIKSCVPSHDEEDGNKKKQKCMVHIPESSKEGEEKVERVAIIAPPGDISTTILHYAEQIANRHNHRETKDQLDIEIIPRTNVPPYGYGKTHGLSKIIRLVPQPLVLEVTDALQSTLEPGETHESITLQDLRAALRQVLRFHCRLSHVAAHTALLSVGFLEVVLAPTETLSKIESFVTPNDLFEKSSNGDDDMFLQFAADDDQEGLFDAQEAYGTQLLTHIQSTSPGLKYGADVNKALDDVLLEEMRLTKNLTVWPCPSFWAAGDAPDPLNISPIIRRIAEALSPACNGDPQASCFVEKDKCEARGDALCDKKKKKKKETR